MLFCRIDILSELITKAILITRPPANKRFENGKRCRYFSTEIEFLEEKTPPITDIVLR